MNRIVRTRSLMFAGALALFLTATAIRSAAAESPKLTVKVTDAKSGDPIFQASLTLEFHLAGGFMKHSKWISYSAKTDKKGEYKFSTVPEGPIRLFVTAPDHQAFGHSYKFDKDHQTIEVKLRKPQPML